MAFRHVCCLRSSSALPMRQRGLDLFLGSARCHLALASWLEGDPPSGKHEAQGAAVDKRWKQFFSNPSDWWDHRSDKTTAMYPDFTHKKTREGLWISGRLNPKWVEVQLATVAPGSLQRNAFSWNVRLTRYVKDGHNQQTLDLFQQMKNDGISLDKCTFIPVLKACANLGSLEEGRSIHAEVIRSGCELDIFVGTSLVDMYAKCGSIDEAWGVFNKMSTYDVVTWNAMIQGCAKCGQGLKALELFQHMQIEQVVPNTLTFVGALNACASVAALDKGRQIHSQAIHSGCEASVFVGNSLVDMYAKCGSPEDAWRVFSKMRLRDVVTWNTMIAGYVKCGQGEKALEVFQMMERANVRADLVTFVGILNACASVDALKTGRHVHAQIIQNGCEASPVLCNSLIDMYCKCSSTVDAQRVFDKMPMRDAIAWNAMIMGYVKCGQGQRALELSRQMQAAGVEPDPATFVGALAACTNVASLDEGMQVHAEILQRGLEANVFVRNSLIDMYAKCGSIENAWRVFNKMPICDVVACNAMLGGYAMHGLSNEALRLFEWICRERVETDVVTFVCLISACSHSGLVDEGLLYFQSMRAHHGVSATIEHYVCMVDLLGRAGRLHEAEDMIKFMPFEHNVVVWQALYGASRMHFNTEMGDRIAKTFLMIGMMNQPSISIGVNNLVDAVITGDQAYSKFPLADLNTSRV